MDEHADGSHPAPDLPPGWSRPRPEHVPHATYWPAVMALGITFALWGWLTAWIVTIVGIVLAGIGLAGWIGDLRAEEGGEK